ncbi:MAG: DUF934 domain-containing protein [Burkholderiaceae bacterium]
MKFIDKKADLWHALGGEDGPPVSINPQAHLLLNLTQWHAARAQWPRGILLGLSLGNDQDVEDIAEEIASFSLVVLNFPRWVDGRAYSQARLLRARYRFKGEIRATGEVLVDMIPLLVRTGFDAAAMRADQAIDVAQQALEAFRAHYQGDVHSRLPLFALPAGAADALALAPVREFVNEGAAI